MTALALIPVILVEPWNYDRQDHKIPTGTIADLPKAWETYNQKCYQDSGLKHLQAIETGSHFFALDTVQTDDLSIILAEMYSEYLKDSVARQELLDDMVDRAPFIPGGFALQLGDRLIHLPGCCCGLESIEEWQTPREQTLTTPVYVWTGHDQVHEVMLSSDEKKVTISVGESEHYTLSLAAYHEFLYEAERCLSRFFERAGHVLDTLFGVKTGQAMARAMVYK